MPKFQITQTGEELQNILDNAALRDEILVRGDAKSNFLAQKTKEGFENSGGAEEASAVLLGTKNQSNGGLDNTGTSVAIGDNNSVGDTGMALGRNNIAILNSYALGDGNEIQDYDCENNFLIGFNNTVRASKNTGMIGFNNTATGAYSIAAGYKCRASGRASFTEGEQTIAQGKNSHAEGRFNVARTDAIHSVGIGTASTDRADAEVITQSGEKYIKGIGGFTGYETNLSNVKSVQQVAEETDKKLVELANSHYVPITWQELKDLRDADALTPGSWYRITDYECTTTQPNTRSAGNLFDLLVLAASTNTLAEEAFALHHDGDEYFTESNLSAWKLWYCLDNDKSRFYWADETAGKGVIYRMIDEFNNDIPYDFKNIQFKRYILNPNDAVKTNVGSDAHLTIVKQNLQMLSHKIHTSFWYYGEYISDVYPDAGATAKYVPFGDINYDSDGPQVLCKINENNFGWYFTFTNSDGGDGSLAGQDVIHDNTIKFSNYLYVTEDEVGKITIKKNSTCLNDIIFNGNYCYSNSFGSNCYSNSFGNGCDSNSFGSNCYSNSFGSGCDSNSFGSGCYSNSFGSDCYSNSFGSDCYSNSFGSNCYSNSFGSGCHSNSFGSGCYSNSFGSDCYSNSFGSDCYANSFGSECSSNSFGSGCYSNSFGSECYSNSFGSNCGSNSFGSNCYSNSFALDSGALTKGHYYRGNHFGDECSSIVLCSTNTASSLAQVQNYNFTQGLSNVIIQAERARDYETKVAKNSNGELKIYCEADLIQ